MKYYLSKSKEGKEYHNGSISYGLEVYENNLDYCLIEDFMNREEIMEEDPKPSNEEEPPTLSFWISQLFARREQIEEFLDGIYAIQSKKAGSPEYKHEVAKRMPYVVKLGRDIESKEFQRELWDTGEFCEKLLKTGADTFDNENDENIRKLLNLQIKDDMDE